jgi:hypothetical protein
METVTVEVKNKKAMNLLKELEELDIIKIRKPAEKVSSKDKASKYRGVISPIYAEVLLKHTKESRKEWEKRFPTK